MTIEKITKFGIVAALIMVLAYMSYQYIVHRVDGKCQVKAFLKPKFDFWCLIVMIAGLFASCFVFIRCFLFEEQGYMRAIMNTLVMLWLCVIGYIDAREKIIPNAMILVGLISWLILSLVDIFLGGTPVLKLVIHSSGGILCAGILFVIAIIVKSALGMGDVKMFLVLGLLYGFQDAYGILLFTVIAMAVVSITLLLFKKVTLKTAIPMAPFVSIGFLLSILAGI